MALVTIPQAIAHLRIDEDEALDAEFLADLSLKIEQASALVLRYVRLPDNSFEDSSGDPLTVPFHLSAAVLIWLGLLFKNRDGESDEALAQGAIPKAVSNILVMYRVPSLA